MHKLIREPFNGLSHLVAAIVALFGLAALAFLSQDDGLKLISLLVYGASLTLMMASSSAYHSVFGSPRRIKFLRKLDHAAIFMLIAGTYTPLCINLFSGFWRWGLLTLIWGIAITGIISKMIFINTPRWFTVVVYIAMGWFALSALGEIGRMLSVGAIVLLAVGGVVYTLGAVVYATKIFNFKPGVFGFHEVWHLFVVGGALSHFLLVLLYVALP